MRVNVTYSVEIEKVEEIVKSLLLEASQKIDDLLKEFPKITLSMEAKNENQAVDAIENCKSSVLTIDHCLFDCKSILMGHQQTMLQIKNEGENDIASG
jgi:chemotaxis response regulator CheB